MTRRLASIAWRPFPLPAPWNRSTSPWPPASCSISSAPDARYLRHGRRVHSRTLRRLLPQRLRRALAARVECRQAAIALSELRAPALLVREHSRGELARPSRALPLLPGTDLAHLSAG